jgi:uncharacterized damage-inducible protein DinB
MTLPVAGFGHDTIAGQFVHLLFSEEAWIRAAQCLEYRTWNDAFTDADVIAALKSGVMTNTRDYLESLLEADLNNELTRVPDYWVGPRRSPAFICHHVLTHAFHHKGQMAAMFRFLGHPLPDTDMQRQD